MDATAQLLIIESIKSLKARYFRLMDTKSWAELARVFSPDAVFDCSEIESTRNPVTGEWNPPFRPAMLFEGRQAIVDMIRAGINDLCTVHHGHMPEIDVLSETSARGVWAMEDLIRTERGELLLHGFGHYHEVYEKSNADWTIKRTKLTRLYLSQSERHVSFE